MTHLGLESGFKSDILFLTGQKPVYNTKSGFYGLRYEKPGITLGKNRFFRYYSIRFCLKLTIRPTPSSPSVAVSVSNQRAARVANAYAPSLLCGANHVWSETTLQEHHDDVLNFHSTLQRGLFVFIDFALMHDSNI